MKPALLSVPIPVFKVSVLKLHQDLRVVGFLFLFLHIWQKIYLAQQAQCHGVQGNGTASDVTEERTGLQCISKAPRKFTVLLV